MHVPQSALPIERIDTIRTQCATLEQRTAHCPPQPRILEQRRRWWHAPGRGRLATRAALGLILALLQPVQARTFPCGAGDSSCLIAAINAANANGQTNMILLAAGTYTLTAAYNETPPDPQGLNGLPVVTSSLIIQGAGAALTSIERDASAPGFRLLRVTAAGTLTLKRLTLRGGNAASGTLTGGGIYSTGTVMLIDSTLTDNRASAGGGIYSEGTVTLTNSTLTDNMSDGEGSGLANFGGTVTLTNSTLTDNFGGAGGGLSNFSGTVTLTNSTLASNSGHEAGGGLFNFGGGTVMLTNSTLTANGSETGGGLANFSSGSTATLINSTLADNFGGEGGGLANLFGGTVTFINSTLAYNNAGLGGGGITTDDRSSTTLQNTILTLNTSPEIIPVRRNCGCRGSVSCGDGVVTSLGTNLFGDLSGCPISLHNSDLDDNDNPGLGAFTDTGAPGNGHVPLLQGSPAIDAGNDAVCPPRDQLGQRRVDIPGVGTSRCDIGAIEFQRRDTQQRDEALATAVPATP